MDAARDLRTALDRLAAGGSTAGAEGLELAYRVAALYFELQDYKQCELEAENAKLKKLLAEAHLDVEALKVAFGVKR